MLADEMRALAAIGKRMTQKELDFDYEVALRLIRGAAEGKKYQVEVHCKTMEAARYIALRLAEEDGFVSSIRESRASSSEAFVTVSWHPAAAEEVSVSDSPRWWKRIFKRRIPKAKAIR